VKITPDSRLIRSLAAQSGLTHQRALCEWIDNAFDAGAMVVSITFGKRGGHSFVEVEDDGREFNPLASPPVDVSVPLERRPIGGLGIHMIRQLMDSVTYRRENGRNILKLVKRITA